MTPEEVPDDLVEKAARALAVSRGDELAFAEGYDPNGTLAERRQWHRKHARAALAAALPSYKQRVTAKYRRFVKAVRVITRNGESYQTPKSQGGGGDECTISPPELRQALRDLRDGRQ